MDLSIEEISPSLHSEGDFSWQCHFGSCQVWVLSQPFPCTWCLWSYLWFLTVAQGFLSRGSLFSDQGEQLFFSSRSGRNPEILWVQLKKQHLGNSFQWGQVKALLQSSCMIEALCSLAERLHSGVICRSLHLSLDGYSSVLRVGNFTTSSITTERCWLSSRRWFTKVQSCPT